MSELYDEIETRPYLLYLNQIKIPEVGLELPETEIKKIAEGLGKKGVNFALPLVCITEEEDQYQLLTGLPIYKAAESANIQKIWVFLIAAKQPEAEEAVEQALFQSKHNQRVGETQDEPSISQKDFLEFVNDEKSNLTLIPGIGKKSTIRIVENRPYTSLEDMQNKLGSKTPLKKWIKAYQQNDKLK